MMTMMEAVRASEMFVYFYETTRCYIPEDYLHIHCCKNPKYRFKNFCHCWEQDPVCPAYSLVTELTKLLQLTKIILTEVHCVMFY
jgi:hypothetical protein